MTSDLWIDLEKRIYSLPYEDVHGGVVLVMTYNGSAVDRSLRNQCAKEKCANRLKLRIATERATSMYDTLGMETAKRCLIYSLDRFMLRLSAPLSFLLLFVTVLLFAQHFDGSDIPLWVCAIPLELLISYLITVVSLACVFLAKASHMWSNIEVDVFCDHLTPIASLSVSLFVCLFRNPH